MARRVEYRRLGDPRVLEIREVAEPQPEAGRVRVRVHAAALNPLDAKIFRGLRTASGHAVELPSGNGSDFAGVVDAVGEGVDPALLGSAVLGLRLRHAQADYVVADPARLSTKPDGLSWELAAALPTVGRTAVASVAGIAPGEGDTILVSAAAGGVGVLAAQLARRRGARVIGTAGPANHEFLRSLDIEPVAYGDGLVERVRAIAPEGITGALDNHGRASVEAALALGAPAERINTIADYDAPADFGTGSAGMTRAEEADFEELIALVDRGEVLLPIDSVYPLDDVTAAYERLIAGHVRGKLVLRLV